MRANASRPRKTKLVVLSLLVVIALVAGGAFAYRQTHHTSTSKVATAKDGSKLDLTPATTEEKQESETAKDTTVKNETPTPPPTTPSTLKAVTPTIVDAGLYDGQVEVRAYVGTIFENGGSCTITFTHGSQKVTKQVSATEDAKTTRCTNLSIAQSELPASGTWAVVVSYTSATAKGDSAVSNVEIP